MRAQGAGDHHGGVRSVLGCAWVSGADGRTHVRVAGGRVYPRASVWGHHRRALKARPEELVYPLVRGRVAALWGHDPAVRGLLAEAADEPAQARAGTYAVLADRLEELGATDDAGLLRAGGWKGEHTCPPPGAGSPG
jgi:hypothetical protein